VEGNCRSIAEGMSRNKKGGMWIDELRNRLGVEERKFGRLVVYRLKGN
jgi:hypothetical protein